jgi:rod shape-determining protein MreB
VGWWQEFIGSFRDEIGIDLGTANTLVYVRGRGIVLREPSVVAIDLPTGEPLAVGEEAKSMIGKTPGRIVAMRPLKDGVIADWEYTEVMLRYLIHKATRPQRFIRLAHKVVIGIPSGITAVEKRAVVDAAHRTGAQWVYLVDEPMAAAIGCNMTIHEAIGNMIVDIGGGTTEVAVISLNDIVVSKSIRVAGDELDKAIIDYARRRYNLLIGERTSERIKIEVGSAHESSEIVEITTEEVRESMWEKIDMILKTVRYTLEETPPELAADIIDQGIVLCGGGALLRDLDMLIYKDTGIVTKVASDPLSAVVLGTQKILEDFSRFRNLLATRGK